MEVAGFDVAGDQLLLPDRRACERDRGPDPAGRPERPRVDRHPAVRVEQDGSASTSSSWSGGVRQVDRGVGQPLEPAGMRRVLRGHPRNLRLIALIRRNPRIAGIGGAPIRTYRRSPSEQGGEYENQAERSRKRAHRRCRRAGQRERSIVCVARDGPARPDGSPDDPTLHTARRRQQMLFRSSKHPNTIRTRIDRHQR